MSCHLRMNKQIYLRLSMPNTSLLRDIWIGDQIAYSEELDSALHASIINICAAPITRNRHDEYLQSPTQHCLTALIDILPPDIQRYAKYPFQIHFNILLRNTHKIRRLKHPSNLNQQLLIRW